MIYLNGYFNVYNITIKIVVVYSYFWKFWLLKNKFSNGLYTIIFCKIDLQNTYCISIIIIKFNDDDTSLLIFWISLIIDGYTIVLCYTSGEIIDCEFGVCYNCPPEKSVSINSMITFDELDTKLCHALNINHTYTKLNMMFRYPVPFPNGRDTVNYVPLPIWDDGDVSIMFNIVAQSPSPNTIEMYCQTSSIDHHPMPRSFIIPMHIESVGPS